MSLLCRNKQELQKCYERINDLEKIVCPDMHDWMPFGHYLTKKKKKNERNHVFRYKCEKCNKIYETTLPFKQEPIVKETYWGE